MAVFRQLAGQYAAEHGLSERAVIDRIQSKEIDGVEDDGFWFVRVDTERDTVSRETAEAAGVDLELEAASRVMITTEAAPVGLSIAERVDVITSECVFGVNVFRDLLADVRGIVGGRSGGLQKVLKDGRETVLLGLRKEAAAKGADAVIAIAINYAEINAGMLMVTATGTAVRLQQKGALSAAA